MRTRTRKPAPPPVIDLGGRVAVIDATGEKPKWKVLARVPAASTENARRVARENGVTGVWLLDDLGGKEYVTL